jgi:hypothetical protein
MKGKSYAIGSALLFSTMLIAATLTITFAKQADAYHYISKKWNGGYHTECPESTSLDTLNIGWFAAATAIDARAAEWAALPGSYTPDSWPSCTSPLDPNLWRGSNLNDATKAGKTVIFTSGSFITGGQTDLNNQITWTTSGCNDAVGQPRNINYVARHEQGHWVAFKDISTAGKVTVMWSIYKCTQHNSIKTDDKNELLTIYP